jgi:hypothetical protein
MIRESLRALWPYVADLGPVLAGAIVYGLALYVILR